jgi:hypothetical protein
MPSDKEHEIFKATLQADVETHKATLARQLESWKENAAWDRRAWEHSLDWEVSSFKAVIDFALFSIRSLILVNGGAVVAILAFLGSIWGGDNKGGATAVTHAIAEPLGYFIGGLVCAMLTAMFSYLAQVSFTESQKMKAGKASSGFGASFRAIAILLAAVSLGLFFYGAWRAVEAFASVGP